MPDYEQIESSQRQHHQVLEHNERMNAFSNLTDFSIIGILKPKINREGNKWMVLYGENLQVGIAGFGDTIREAIIDFNGAFDRKI